jgi:predicted O-linked N-acetylglucosamine transferase (SPINDLY family)
LRERLAEAHATSRLFDTPRHTRSLENAYGELVRRLDAGAAPTDLVIA